MDGKGDRDSKNDDFDADFYGLVQTRRENSDTHNHGYHYEVRSGHSDGSNYVYGNINTNSKIDDEKLAGCISTYNYTIDDQCTFHQ